MRTLFTWEAVISSVSLSPWNTFTEPNQGNIRQWLENLKSKTMPVEQARWNESNIDSLFYAGAQQFINQNFNTSPSITNSQYFFNISQQPINMLTGYQRQHRKNVSYVAVEGADPQTTDQYTKLMTHSFNMGSIHEQYSKGCELAAVTGMTLVQPYLDYTEDDPAQGTLKLKVWEYPSFLMDPYWRSPDMSDANYIWFQEYISKEEAEMRFPDMVGRIQPMTGHQRLTDFYFLPENYNMATNNLFVISYVWYKWRKKKKRLYSRSKNQFYDFAKDANTQMLLSQIRDLEVVNVDVQCWKLATVLNDQLMFVGENPMGFEGCPAIPIYWNYEPHLNHYNIRVRGLMRTMRSPQFLLNHKIITNNDIAAATINAGWKRKSGAVANEDNLKKASQGYDIIINPGFQMTDVEKIIPTAVPESDLALADQMQNLIFAVSGMNMENWAGQQDKQISSLTMLMKQAANLLVFQKYFDQWDFSLKILGKRCLDIALNNWNAEKVALYIGEEPTAHFYSKVFANYQTIVEESDLTPTQQNLQAQQMMDINQMFGREVFPPSMIIPKLNITGKGEIIPYLQQQEQQMSAAQQEEMNLKHTVEDMKLRELMAKIHNQLSQARERDSRSASNVGLFEERISEISKNHAISTREKMDALTKMLEAIQKFGEVETFLRANQLETIKYDEEEVEKEARTDIEKDMAGKNFLEQIMANQPQNQMQQQNQYANMAGML